MPMSRMRTSIAIAALGAVALAGCSSSGGSDTETGDHAEHSTTQTADATTEAAAGAPDEATLLAVVEGIGDPNLPTAQKVDLVQDGTDREAVIEAFNAVLANYPLTFGVSDVVEVDPTTATAQVDVAGPHGGAPIPFTFVEQDGSWKLADPSFCALAAMGQVAC
ncbi:hypothetical protein [Millisia brevis]|uniref:hypothetical protein n=1 Tax=Millisia brevis TaxID=264148 RepID=UPI00082D9F73|nr:hypothetical protein [Millisia brevis]